MAGPPTPPPSSAQEIQDAQRAPASTDTASEPPASQSSEASQIEVDPTTEPIPASTTPAAVASSLPPVAESQPQVPPFRTPHIPEAGVYQALFPTLVDLASKRDYARLIEAAETGDLNADGDHHPTRLLVIVPLVLSYLTLDNIPPAIFALTRLPDNLRSLATTQALFHLTASTSERKYSNIYGRAADLITASQSFQVPGANFPEVVKGMTDAFIDAFRRKTFALLSKAYSSIHISQVQKYLGFEAEQAIAVAKEYQWSYDPSSGVFSPSTAALAQVAADAATRRSGPSSLSTFESLANSLILDTE
ncbi:hypothetical protein K474DRAFT_1662981 [Panus rudis PR-1116 ss-1]|nr:hypothetical protein K474DRAFT_1662981 [Panus rudis PR-1116 ss-1]